MEAEIKAQIPGIDGVISEYASVSQSMSKTNPDATYTSPYYFVYFVLLVLLY